MERINLTERIFFYIVFLILLILTLLMRNPFVTVLIVSLISVIILKPVYNYFLERSWIHRRKGLAASLTLVSVFIILVIPVLLIAWLTISQLSNLFEQLAALDLDAILADIQQTLASLPLVGSGSPAETHVTEGVRPLVSLIAQAIAEVAISLGSSIPSLLVQGIIFVVVVASLLPVYDTLIPRFEEISPLGPELSKLYTRKITAMINSLVMGVFLLAIIQGVAMGIVYWIAGLPYIFLLSLLTMLLALIPMVGPSWLVITVAVIAFLTGNWVQGVIVLLGFYGAVNWIDILLRPRLLAEDASINFALFILAIFGGLAWAGIMGLFYGPVIMLLLVTTIQIYAERYANEDVDIVGQALRNLANPQDPVESSDAEPGEAEGQDT